ERQVNNRVRRKQMRNVQRRTPSVCIQIEWIDWTRAATVAAIAERADDPGSIVDRPTVSVRNLSLDVLRKTLLYLCLESVVRRTSDVGIEQHVAQESARRIPRFTRATATNVVCRKKISRSISYVTNV